ncbi:MAG: phosphoenolpyruvate--protein phosphotransferase, partial [Alteromonadaceae bacterium]
MNSILSTSTLILKAPLSGPLLALEKVPDPVFSQKMVGDGISIDPTNNQLCAPCDGKVIQLHRAGHAVTIESANGLEVLMHIGIDTVSLGGVGFSPKIALGDQVKLGDLLIEFDADFIATKATSLLTQIIITNTDEVQSFVYGQGYAECGKDTVLELTTKAASETSEPLDLSESLTSEPILVPNPTGLHARPSAVLVGTSKKFKSKIVLRRGNDEANAKSVISIMSVEFNCGDSITVTATGPDANEAVNTITQMIKDGLGEDCPPVTATASAPKTEEASAEQSRPRSDDPNLLLGVTASPGFAIGKVFQLEREDIQVDEKAADKQTENALLDKALKEAFNYLDQLQSSIEDKEKAAIFAAHQELLEDPELLDTSRSLIVEGKSAAYAWKNAYTNQACQLAKLKSELLAARANDLRDVGYRVLLLILGREMEAQELPENTILIAEDLTPSDTAQLDRTKVLGFCTVMGGATSHVAILARSMNIPAIAGIEQQALSLHNGDDVILDAGKASLRLNPSQEEIQQIRDEQASLAAKQKEDLANASKPSTTLDGTHIEVVANTITPKETTESLELGGEGVGLLRSEFLFMNRATAPTEDEQYESYANIAKALKPEQTLIIRTLDVGGDKPLSYMPIEEEENPFLGLRGIRVSLARQQIFRVQLRAILRASNICKVHIMFPMVTTMEDLRTAKSLLEEERVQLGVDPIPVGIMVEVPSTAIMADQFAKEADFFSIGTNDLTQYTLAIDRGHPILAAQADALNPAVLQLIANTAKGAAKHGKWTGICGGIASDEQATAILLGLGVNELSVSVP